MAIELLQTNEPIEDRKQERIDRLMVILVSLIPLAFFTTAAVLGYNNYRTYSSEISTAGQTIDVIEDIWHPTKQSQLRKIYYPVVSFTLPDGRVKTIKLLAGNSSPTYTKGESVTIRYNPEKITEARIEPLAIELYLIPSIFAMFGFGLSSFPIAYYQSERERVKSSID